MKELKSIFPLSYRSRSRFIKMIFCLASVILFVSIIWAESIENIEITGKGYPPDDPSLTQVQKRLLARRAAIVDAYRNALIYQNRYNQKKWRAHPYQELNISGKIKGARIIETIEKEDGWVEVKILIPRRK